MADEPDISDTTLAHIERELANVKDALGLLGAKPCCACGKFYLSSTSGNLFNSGTERVCYTCISTWWRERCTQLNIPERQAIEHKLMRWLIEYHDAKVFRELRELPPSEVQDVHLIVECAECNGTGTQAGERCPHCLGNRNVWVITFKRSLQKMDNKAR